MTVQIPLRYSGVVFATAKIDDDVEVLKDLGYYSVTLPKNLRSTASKRPDVILAMLKEDPSSVYRCTPFLSVLGTQVLLVHMIIRGEIGRLIVNHVLGREELLVILFREEINQIRGSIGRIAYANNDRTDCRRENLREL